MSVEVIRDVILLCHAWFLFRRVSIPRNVFRVSSYVKFITLLIMFLRRSLLFRLFLKSAPSSQLPCWPSSSVTSVQRSTCQPIADGCLFIIAQLQPANHVARGFLAAPCVQLDSCKKFSRIRGVRSITAQMRPTLSVPLRRLSSCYVTRSKMAARSFRSVRAPVTHVCFPVCVCIVLCWWWDLWWLDMMSAWCGCLVSSGGARLFFEALLNKSPFLVIEQHTASEAHAWLCDRIFFACIKTLLYIKLYIPSLSTSLLLI